MRSFIVPKGIKSVSVEVGRGEGAGGGSGNGSGNGGSGVQVVSFGPWAGVGGGGGGGSFTPLTDLDRCLQSPEIVNAMNKWPIGPDGEPRGIDSNELGIFLKGSVGDLFTYKIVDSHEDGHLIWTLTDFGMGVLATVLAKRFAGVE